MLDQTDRPHRQTDKSQSQTIFLGISSLCGQEHPPTIHTPIEGAISKYISHITTD
uniref:Uncharacterized protein n=1 Tax=Arion vulgaris TaxID=1028688 RepID=A0A0B6ZUT4_9EUPU